MTGRCRRDTINGPLELESSMVQWVRLVLEGVFFYFKKSISPFSGLPIESPPAMGPA